MRLRLWNDVYEIEAMRLRLWNDVYEIEAMMLLPGLGSSWTILENLTSMGSVDSNREGDSVRIIVEPERIQLFNIF